MSKYPKNSKYSKDEIMVFEYADGRRLEVGIMGAFEVNGSMYAALENLKDGSIYLYRYIEMEDSFDLEEIPDEDFDAVQKQFDILMKEQ